MLFKPTFYFFTDIDLFLPQASTDAFGPQADTVVSSVTKQQFLVTSLHSAISGSKPGVYAVCDGRVAVQIISNTLVNIIFKPDQQPSSVDLPNISYIIYKGVLRSSLSEFIGSTYVIPADNADNINDLTVRIKSAHDNLVIDGVSTDPYAFEEELGVGLDPVTPNFGNLDPLDNLFYLNGLPYTPRSVKGGWKIGIFDSAQFGIEIITETVNYKPQLGLTRSMGHYIQVDKLTGSETQGQRFKHWHNKEEAIYYMDPSAFYGSFYFDIIKAKASTDSDFTPYAGKDIYDKILKGTQQVNPGDNNFYNRNKVYLDIRNEYNHSLDYYKNYGSVTGNSTSDADSEIMIYDYTETLVNKNYYTNSWPILILSSNIEPPNTNPDFKPGNTSQKIVTKLALPKGDSDLHLLYLSKGYKNKGGNPFSKQKVKDRFFTLATDASTQFTKTIEIAFPNYENHPSNDTVSISYYVRLKYFKKLPETTVPSSGTVIRQSDYLDNIFLPIGMTVQLPGSDRIKTKVYNEEVYIDLRSVNGTEVIANLGIAIDVANVSIFAFPKYEISNGKVKLQGTLSESSFTSNDEDHFFNLLAARYNSVLVESNLNFTGAPVPTVQILRFDDTKTVKPEGFTTALLSDELLAITIKQTAFQQLGLQASTFGFSTDYNIFFGITTRNSPTDEDDGGNKYTGFELKFAGFEEVISGGNLQTVQVLEEPTGLRIFGYPDELILKDDNAHVAVSNLDDFLNQAPCTATNLSQEQLEAMLDFINDLLTAENDPNGFAPSKKIYEEVFSGTTGDIIVTGAAGSRQLIVNHPERIPVGFLSEASYLFAMYLFRKQLRALIHRNPALDIDTDLIKPDGQQAPIYAALKGALILSGFTAPGPDAASRKVFNTMLDPDVYNGFFDIDETLIEILSGSSQPKDSRKLRMLNIIRNGGFTATDLPTGLPLAKAREKAIEVAFENMYAIMQRLLEKEATCFFNAILNGGSPPKSIIMATGDGSVTTGLLGEVITPPNPNPNLGSSGVLFFTYKLTGKAGDSRTTDSQYYAVIQPRHEIANQFETIGGGTTTVIHLSMYGADFPTSWNLVDIKLKNADGKVIHCVFKANSSTNATKILSPVQSTAELGSITTLPPGTVAFGSPIGTNLYVFYDPLSGNIIGLYNLDLQDFSLTVTDKVKFDIELISAAGTGVNESTLSTWNYDEVQLMLNVVQSPVDTITLALPDFFDDDRFELNDTRIANLFNSIAQSKIDSLLNKIDSGIQIVILMNGNFIGKWVGNRGSLRPSVQQDTDYLLSKPRSQREPDHIEPDSDPNDPQNPYARLRYSFARIDFNNSFILINIESYASPLRSRLDKRIDDDTYHGWNAATKTSLKTRLQNFTLLGNFPSTDAYLLKFENLPFNAVSNPKIPSYNQLLTALRCMGILEAIFTKLKDRASQLSLTSVPTILNNYFDTNNVNHARAATVRDASNTLLFVTPQDYADFKWYIDAADQQNFDGNPNN